MSKPFASLLKRLMERGYSEEMAERAVLLHASTTGGKNMDIDPAVSACSELCEEWKSVEEATSFPVVQGLPLSAKRFAPAPLSQFEKKIERIIGKVQSEPRKPYPDHLPDNVGETLWKFFTPREYSTNDNDC